MLIKNVKIARSFSDQFFGLINGKNPRQMMFFTRFGIHTFGLSQKIDVLILDEYYRVVVIKENLLPNRVFLWNPRYFIALELPAGIIKERKIKIGQKIRIQTAKEG